MFSACSYAFTYHCKVTKKYSFNLSSSYSEEEIKKGEFSIRILDSGNYQKIDRCSYSPSSGYVTCDTYPTDRREVDSGINVRKYYIFNPQFDIQIFSNLEFIENNGRGGLAAGTCTVN